MGNRTKLLFKQLVLLIQLFCHSQPTGYVFAGEGFGLIVYKKQRSTASDYLFTSIGS